MPTPKEILDAAMASKNVTNIGNIPGSNLEKPIELPPIEKPKTAFVTGMTTEPTVGKITVTKNKTELEQSIDELNLARNGRNPGEIPLDDPYWAALNKHQTLYARSKE